MSSMTLLIGFACLVLLLAATGMWYLLRQMKSLSDAHAANERALAESLTGLLNKTVTTNQELTALAAAKELTTYQGILAMRESDWQASASDEVEERDDGEDEFDRLSAAIADDLDPIAGYAVRDEPAGRER
jgi:uncharacterized protein with NAD-binding domain and iron-sulfur cluster